MCAIAGGYSRSDVERMLALMAHRAPDDSDIVGDGFHIGMGRLKIFDLTSSGLCPIVDGNLVLTFNGEIYNYLELREDLKKLGHVFTTESDSEVLLKAYKEWGVGCLQSLNGMFAFAILDGSHGTVLLARDIAGEKPLYFSRNPFRFASEAKALGFNCEELPPASFAIYSLDDGSLLSERWWEFSPVELDNDVVDQLDQLLDSSVSLRARAHVPVGLYYSGGIDSSLIATYHTFDRQYTYTDGDYKDEFLATFPKILWHLDYPIKSFSAFGLWKLAEEASEQGTKVVISGEGADELFGGYVRYVGNEFNRKAREKFPSYQQLFPYRDMLREEFDGNMRELLRMGDRMASAWGIENRCPFLDRRIIEFAMSLPMEWKIDGLETKRILRELLKRRDPGYIFEEKHGLYCSVNEWIGGGSKFGKDAYLEYQRSLMVRA